MNEETKTKFRFDILAVILIVIFSFCISPITLQNDTFYTIKIGQYVLENGVTMQDPFSWHENLPYTFPHWAYDVMTAVIYNIGGMTGIYISTIEFCAILGFAIYFTNVSLVKNRTSSLILTILSLYIMKDFIAARAQLFTFILFVLTVFCIEKFLETGKKRYAVSLIIIPILIANFHTAVFPFYFVLYMPYIGEYIIYILLHSGIVVNKAKIEYLYKKVNKTKDEEIIEKYKAKILKLEERLKVLEERYEKKEKNAYKIIIKPSKHINKLLIIMIICLFTGLLTPLQGTPYTYLIKTMQGETTSHINEHLPLTLVNNVNFMCTLIILLAILTFTDTKIKLSNLFMIGGLLILTFYSRRQESVYTIIGVLIFNRLINTMFEKYSKKELLKMKNGIKNIYILIILSVAVIAGGIYLYKPKMDDQYISQSSYPVAAAEWIKENLDLSKIKLYNEYNYGSYLLYQDIPVFMDSRADLYTPEFNGGRDIFMDYIRISGLSEQNIGEKFDEYGITHLIMYKSSNLGIYVDGKPTQYKKIYSDDYFKIYERL